jgi:putative oxidoreductase
MMNLLRHLFKTPTYGSAPDAGLLILRLGAGLLMMTHGWPKLMSFTEKAEKFYDFMGLGGEVSLALTIFAEFFCSLCIVFGLGMRIFLIPLIIVSLVIVFVVHGSDPLSEKEHGLLFLVPYLTLLLTGAGKYSLDYFLQKNAQSVIV